MNTFGLITHGRSGTWALYEHFSQHPFVECFTYWFDGQQPIAKEPSAIRKNLQKNWHHQNWISFLSSSPPNKTHLCTWTHYIQNSWIRENTPFSNDRDFWESFRTNQQKIILLRRENLLRQFLSGKIAKSTGKYETYHPRKLDPKPIQIQIDPKFSNFVKEKQTADRKMRDIFGGTNYLEVVYEQLTTNWESEIHRIQDFLGLYRVSIPISTHKQEHRPIRQIVQNYQEIENYLRQQNWDHWLDD